MSGGNAKMEMMTKEELLQICKYYKGEVQSDKNMDYMWRRWWAGEELFVSNCLDDPGFFSRMRLSFEEALSNDWLQGVYLDNSISIEKKIMIYYLDLWHGKWFPYDSSDVIMSY